MMKADLAVIGAGPAGLAAAAAARRAGAEVIVLDESLAPGGRLLCQVHENHSKPAGERWWIGRDVARRLLDEAARAGVTRIMTSAEVWGVFRDDPQSGPWKVMVGGAAPVEIDAGAVLIATGAAEQPAPLPGWTLPGVVTVGAAQVLVNQWRVKPGGRAVIVGLDPLAFTATHSLVMAGVSVVGMVNPAPGPLTGEAAVPSAVVARLSGLSRLAPSTLMRVAGPLFSCRRAAALAASFYLWPALKAWGTPIMLRHAAVAVLGDTVVEGVMVAAQRPGGGLVPGSERVVKADLVCLSGGLHPLAELAASAGCEFTYVPDLGGHLPLHGPFGQTTVKGLFVAGNATGVESAPVAVEQGRLAGLGIALWLDGREPAEIARATREAAAAVERARAEAPLKFLPRIAAGRAEMARRWQSSGGAA
jgi:sarcosine oxidase subunit alpha